MINLTELTKLSNDKLAREEQAKLLASEKELEKYEKIYHDAIDDLENKLKVCAINGKRSYTVATFTMFSYGINEIVFDELKRKVGSHGNYYCAWNKSIFEKDVIEHMKGNLRRIYEYCNENSLNPKIRYWCDGGGMDEGFEVFIEW